MKEIIYLDYNSTTPVDPRIKEKIKEYLDYFGNPSNVYKIGRESKKLLDNARKKVADILNCDKDEIIFTCGGTMANNLALFGLAKSYGHGKKEILCSIVEHPSCLNTVKELSRMGYKVSYIPVDSDGVVKIDILEKMINKNTFLIVLMAINNETGTIQPIEEVAKIAEKQGILFHCDAVQALGKRKIDLSKINISTLSSSGHKFYAPKGVGFLYLKKGINLSPTIFGGHQEREIFPGTENLTSILAMADALEIAYDELETETKKDWEIKKELYKGLKEIYPALKLNGSFEKTVENTLNISFTGKENTKILDKLDDLGIYVGTGTACKGSGEEPSHVLLAMGLSKKEYTGAIRISIGRFTRKEHVAFTIQAFKEVLGDI